MTWGKGKLYEWLQTQNIVVIRLEPYEHHAFFCLVRKKACSGRCFYVSFLARKNNKLCVAMVTK